MRNKVKNHDLVVVFNLCNFKPFCSLLFLREVWQYQYDD
ncbi:MAG: hypothetical protein TRG1_484 [Flavobacteriaceae bacterium FS1-H7996/R]|nr:MAG: hypothetical protein TRG1_484 [Flavobacteriaceae bacterium FS1-H7996/R]